MHVSVIIPVYNAAQYLEEAVNSALAQPETAEVLLIEDGSIDASFSVCQSLASAHDRVKLLMHPNHENRGAGASRNLGLKHASSEYIAFLDADDFYLPARFRTTAQIFASNPDAQGVYETIGAVFDTDSLREKHLQRIGSELTGLDTNIQPEKLYSALAKGTHGHFSLDALVILKDALKDDLTFDTELRQCQDSDWILRLSRSARLYGGTIGKPVTMRRVHAGNRVLITAESIRYQRQFLRKCIRHNFYGSLDTTANFYIVARYVSWSWGGRLRKLGPVSQPIIVIATGLYLLTHPQLLYNTLIRK